MDRPTLGTAKILHGNALDLPLDDNSVDLIVTSPPYFGQRSYEDNGTHYVGQVGSEATPGEFVDALIAATAEMVRVLKPSGSIFVNLGDKYVKGSLAMTPARYAIRCTDELRLKLRAEVVWDKTNAIPESVKDRVKRAHETWFHFTKSLKYFASIDEIRERHTTVKPGQKSNGGTGYPSHMTGHMNGGAHPIGKLPGSVWAVATQPLHVPDSLGVDHYAAFPMEFPRRIISGWAPEFGTVLDPFGGTGTTALVAKVLGREGISVDLSADYCRVAEWRTNDVKQMSNVQAKHDAALAARQLVQV
jgi:DNA modification methylase